MKYIVCIFFFLATCKNKQMNQNQLLVKEVSRKYISTLLEKNKTVSDNIILDVEDKHWASQLTYTHLSMIKNFNIKKESDLIDFYDIFNTGNLYDLNKNRKFEKWSEIFPDLKFSNQKGVDLIISLPILSEDRNYAIFYLADRYSGNLVVYKKIDSEWQYFAIGNVWIS